MNVLIINQFASTPEYSSGAGERHFYLANTLKNNGINLTIISGGRNHLFLKQPQTPKLFNYENIPGGQFVWVKLKNYSSKSLIGRAFSWVEFLIKIFSFPIDKNNRPDVIVVSSMSLLPAIYAVYIKFRYQIPFVLEIRDIWPLTPIQLGGYSAKNPFIFLFSRLERFSYAKVDAFISLFPNFNKYLQTVIKKDKPVYWIPNAIDENYLEDTGFSPLFKIPARKFVVIYTGTLGITNAMQCFIESAKLLKKNDDILFLIVGDGSEKEKIKTLAKDLNNVVLYPKIQKIFVLPLIKKTDVCFISWHNIQMNEYGVSANKYNDYMLAAKPIISASNIPDDPVLKANCGFRVESGNAREIADAILKLYNMDQNERDALGRNGFNYVMKHNT